MRRAAMRQLRLQEAPRDREIGFALCRAPDGGLARGPVTTGHKFGVDISLECPPESELFGTFHTHPGGTAEPSPQDREMTRRHGLKQLCIGVPDTGELKCYAGHRAT